MEIQQRLEEFFRKLQAAPPAANAEEALTLVCGLIEEVEDEFCPVPRETPPPMLRFTGRMYPPQEDSVKPAHGGVKATTRRHIIYCSGNGRITIRHRLTLETIFVKKGKVE